MSYESPTAKASDMGVEVVPLLFDEKVDHKIVRVMPVAAWQELAADIRRFDPDIVVLVARKMPRLAECLNLDFGSRCVVVSDLAIPFVHHELRGARVAVVDDIVNVGSTIQQACTSTKVCGAVETKMFALASRRARPLISADIEYVWSEPLKEREYSELVNQVPSTLQYLAKPYDLEFPIMPCRLSVPFRGADDLERWLRNRYGQSSVRTLTRYCIPGSLSRVSLDIRIGNIGNYKLRFYLDERSGTCNVVPFAISPSIGQKMPEVREYDISKTLFAALLRSLDGCPEQATLWPLEPHARAFLFVRSLDFGLQQLDELGELVALTNDLPVSLQDMELLFGPVELQLHDTGTPVRTTGFPQACDLKSTEAVSPFYTFLCNSEVGERFLARLRDLAQLGCGYILFSEIFDELARLVGASDPESYSFCWPYSREEISGAPYLRLRIGPTFEDLVQLFETLSPTNGDFSVSPRNQVSTLLDYAIDRGNVVPAIARYRKRFYRIYRKGESDARDTAVNRALYAWQQHGKAMTLTRFSKINAIMAFSAELPEVLAPSTLTHGNVASLQATALDLGEAEISRYAQRTGRLVRAES